jgi:Flp pilus assembly protein TadD
VAAREPFALWSLFVAGPPELASYARSAPILTDDRMTLEFSGPREIHGGNAGENGASLMALLGSEGGPAIVRDARARAGAAQWRNRGDMMSRRDAPAIAYDDYIRALQADRSDRTALAGLVRTAILLHRGADALAWVKALAQSPPRREDVPTVDYLVAQSKLLASIGEARDAIEAANQAAQFAPVSAAALEQLASLFADAGDTAQLDSTLDTMRRVSPEAPATHYYASASAFLRGDAREALTQALRATAIEPQYAPAYDLIGAAHTRLGQPDDARAAFHRSLSFDAHDSTAYTNLGVIELAAGNRQLAASYFAEALWLTPDSATARQGLAQAR